MPMSKDRVRFFLPPRYFQRRPSMNNMSRNGMVGALSSAFNLSRFDAEEMMNQNPDGFYVVCRPSQFARFIVFRYDLNEGVNGIKDLQPELFIPRELTRVEKIAEQFAHDMPDAIEDVHFNCDCPETVEDVVQRVLCAASKVDRGDATGPRCNEFDLSKNRRR